MLLNYVYSRERRGIGLFGWISPRYISINNNLPLTQRQHSRSHTLGKLHMEYCSFASLNNLETFLKFIGFKRFKKKNQTKLVSFLVQNI